MKKNNEESTQVVEKTDLELQIEQVKEELKKLKEQEKALKAKDKKPLKGEMKEWTTKNGTKVKGLAVKYYYITKNEYDGKPYMRECSALDAQS